MRLESADRIELDADVISSLQLQQDSNSEEEQAKVFDNNNNIIGSFFNILSNFHWSKSSNLHFSQKNRQDCGTENSVVAEEPLSSKVTINDLPVNTMIFSVFLK